MIVTTDIKTKDIMKGTIKSLDRASIASDRMKNAYAKTKELGSQKEVTNSEQSSPSSFADEKVQENAKRAYWVTTYATRKSTDAAVEGAKNLVRTRTLEMQIEAKRASEKELARTETHVINAAKNTSVRRAVFTRKEAYRTAQKKQVDTFVTNRQTRMLNSFRAKNQAKNSERIGKKVARGASKAVKALLSKTAALIASLSAGGIVALVILLICLLFGAAFYFYGDNTETDSYIPVSAEVEAYTPIISNYASEYGVGEYVELIKAVMMQESGGRGNDPMQSSESGFNKKYSHEPNSITDPEYSIQCGVQAFASAIKQAKVSSPVDMDHIKLALQGYNFGSGYISWALSKHGGYSKANAETFSKEQASKHGWSSYGDTSYVDHVLRYYPYGNYTYDVVDTGPGRLGLPIKGASKKDISSHFGSRSSPGGIGSTNHQGLDIAFGMGTHVLACESGTVTNASWYGALGNCIIIDHGGGVSTIYGHLSKIHVKNGQKVVRGQFIGEVGSTGDSTGPHLHLGVRKNGKLVNPEKGWLSLP